MSGDIRPQLLKTSPTSGCHGSNQQFCGTLKRHFVCHDSVMYSREFGLFLTRNTPRCGVVDKRLSVPRAASTSNKDSW